MFLAAGAGGLTPTYSCTRRLVIWFGGIGGAGTGFSNNNLIIFFNSCISMSALSKSMRR